MQWNPNVREGFFDPINQLYPRVITLSIGFTALHQHSLGWEKAGSEGLTEKQSVFAQNAAPSWGSDASLFPWSAGAQRGSVSFIGDFDGDVVRDVAIKDILGGDD